MSSGIRPTAMGAAAVFFLGCNLLAGLAGRHASAAEEDAETGFMAGAEPRDLGPEDAAGAVLLIHGFAGGGSNFADLPDRVAAAGWRVRVMRLPGHGTNPRDFARQRPADYIDAVRAEYEALSARHGAVALVGHSMGGTLATLVSAERNPDALVLAAPYYRVTHKRAYVMPVERWVRFLGPVVRWVYKGDHFKQVKRREAEDDILSYRWVPLSAAEALADLGDLARKKETLARVKCPVLVVHAPNDDAASYEAAREAYSALGAAEREFVELPESNHQIFWDYDRETVAKAVLDFLGAPGDWTGEGRPG